MGPKNGAQKCDIILSLYAAYSGTVGRAATAMGEAAAAAASKFLPLLLGRDETTTGGLGVRLTETMDQ